MTTMPTDIPATSTAPGTGPWTTERLRDALELQRRATLGHPPADATLRRDRLDRLTSALLGRADELAGAVSRDFGNRPRAATLAGEVGSCVHDIAGLRRNLARWMAPRRPQPGYLRFAGIRAWVEPTPLGVVGVISPWNFPVALALQPVATALAAGNSVLLKTSELTPHTSAVLRDMVGEHFAPSELAVVTGGPEVGAEFARLPFDHLFFTGSPAVGRRVQLAAAANLVPVTLELGGKNPTVVGADADVERAAARIARARLANSGQVCLSPDYVFVPRAARQRFVVAAVASFRELVPTLLGNPDYCSIINDRHYRRITALVEDARAKGAEVFEAVPEGERFPAPRARCIPPTVLAELTEDMDVMHEEVFGPVLGVLPYDSIDEVVRYLNARPAPLAAYWFGPDSADFRDFRARTRSGGVTRNDFALHAAVDGLPFGGVGNSGTGYYHGRFGFDTFSQLRAVAEAPVRFSPTTLLCPPFSPVTVPLLRRYYRMANSRVRRRLDRLAR